MGEEVIQKMGKAKVLAEGESKLGRNWCVIRVKKIELDDGSVKDALQISFPMDKLKQSNPTWGSLTIWGANGADLKKALETLEKTWHNISPSPQPQEQIVDEQFVTS